MAATDVQRMHCMEVWGGNRAVDSGVIMAGLDAWIYCKPFEGAAGGGDVYYVSSCATGRVTRLLVADVSGHGAAVCDTADSLRGLMRRYVNFIDQTRFVGEMNHAFAALARSGCFATAVVTTFFGPTGALSLCNAGHPPPLLYRAATRQWSFLVAARNLATRVPGDRDHGDGDGDADADANVDAEGGTIRNIPLGILDLTDYEQFDVCLGVGDLVLCYTDSLVESRGADGDLLGQDGLLGIVRGLDVGDPAAVVPSLLSAVAAAHAGNLTEDDVTVLLFRPNGLGLKVPLLDRLRAPFRVLGGIANSVRRGGPLPIPELSLANIGGALVHRLNRYRPAKLPAAVPPDAAGMQAKAVSEAR